MDTCRDLHAAPGSRKNGIRILPAEQLVAYDLHGAEHAQRRQDPAGTGIAVKHVRHPARIMGGNAVVYCRQLPALVDERCAAPVAEQPAKVAQERRFPGARSSRDEDPARLSGLPVNSGGTSRMLRRNAEIHRADMPERLHALPLPDGSSAEAHPASAADGDISLCQLLPVAVNRIGQHCL